MFKNNSVQTVDRDSPRGRRAVIEWPQNVYRTFVYNFQIFFIKIKIYNDRRLSESGRPVFGHESGNFLPRRKSTGCFFSDPFLRYFLRFQSSNTNKSYYQNTVIFKILDTNGERH